MSVPRRRRHALPYLNYIARNKTMRVVPPAGWKEARGGDASQVALQTVVSQEFASATTDAYGGCDLEHSHAALRRLPASDKLPCEVTLNFAKALIVHSVHASSNGRHLELYTLADVAKGSESARTYLGTARGARREPNMCAYDATHVLKKPKRCDGVVVRFLSLQGGDKNMAQIARIAVRVAEASAASAPTTAASLDRRKKDAVREMLMRMSSSGRSVPAAPDRAAPAAAADPLPTTGGMPPAAAMLMLQQALTRAEERMAATMKASVDALETRLNARFDSLDRAVKELQDVRREIRSSSSAVTTASAALAPGPALAPVGVKE